MHLIFVRHAQSVANARGEWQGQLDYELSSEGIEQSHALAKMFGLTKLQPTKIYTSPLSRACRTAEICFPDEKIIPIGDLQEGGAGVFSGKTTVEIETEYPDIAAEFQATRNFNIVPGAESRYDLRRRAATVVDFLVKGHSDNDRVVVFTHSGLLMYIVSILTGMNRVWVLRIPNTGVFELILDPDKWTSGDSKEGGISKFQIKKFADVSHLVNQDIYLG